MSTHNHIDRLDEISGYTFAYDGDIPDKTIAVHHCGEGVSILWSWSGISFWQQHSDDCAYHSSELSDMSPKAQLQINDFVWLWYRREVGQSPKGRNVKAMLQEIQYH